MEPNPRLGLERPVAPNDLDLVCGWTQRWVAQNILLSILYDLFTQVLAKFLLSSKQLVTALYIDDIID